MEDEDRVEPIETTVPFQLGRKEEHITFLSSQLSEADARDIQKVLREFSDLFAWTAVDMPGIDPSFHCHRLSVCRDAKPIAQLLHAGELYKRGISSPLLKCLAPDQANYVLREIHEGICGTHSGGRTLAAKVIRAGYYWPTLASDCVKFVQQCKPCQQFGPITHQPPEELHPITVPWPFSIWGMDILGPFPPAKGQVKFLIVAIDHFTKWIEAEAVAAITANNVQKFFWKSVITRFGIPYALITDNGLQFTDRRFSDFLAELGIKHKMTSVEHPQSNGQAEAANKIILKELKRRLGQAKGSWPDHLPEILWAYRCTPQSSTKETPFRLTYGTDAMIPVEIGEPSL
uniref:Pro-Pol polyprotein n=1 Tax=Cajanus cajan TaxID=3821 RepID=A0A151T8A8_CAJCA|nr:Pro-Pol polyprotein [Cajanus cajan]